MENTNTYMGIIEIGYTTYALPMKEAIQFIELLNSSSIINIDYKGEVDSVKPVPYGQIKLLLLSTEEFNKGKVKQLIKGKDTSDG